MKSPTSQIMLIIEEVPEVVSGQLAQEAPQEFGDQYIEQQVHAGTYSRPPVPVSVLQ